MDFPQVAVVSSGQSALRAGRTDAQHIDLIYEAASAAFRGSPLTIRDVDFVIDCGSDVLDGRSISNCGFLGAMGAHHKEESRVEEDGLWGLMYAWQKILSGHAGVGLVIAYSKPSESDLAAFYWSQCDPFFQRPVGLDRVTACGLQAYQYLQRTGVTADALASVAARNFAQAAGNPRVTIGRVHDATAVAAAPVASTPLTELMMSQPLDGAVAVLIASEEVARRSCRVPVWIRGISSAMDEHGLGAREPGTMAAGAVAASAAFRTAGLTDLSRIDLVEVTAQSAAGELMVLEALGLAADGAVHGLYGSDSAPMINPSGGALPADPVMATGLVRVREAALQLAGDAGGNQLVDSSTAVVHAASGIGMQNHCVAVLER